MQRCYGHCGQASSLRPVLFARPGARPHQCSRPRSRRAAEAAAAHAVAADSSTPSTSSQASSAPSLLQGSGTPHAKHNSNATANHSQRIKLRVCRVEDVPAVAAICAQAFGFGNFPGIDNTSLQELEERYAVSIEKEVIDKLTQALTRKAEAQVEHRSYRLSRQNQLLRAQLAVAEGRRATFPGQESPEELRQLQKWRRARMYQCILACDADSGQVLACVNVSLMQPEAVLPPPFPSNAPLRFYCSNMAVCTGQRRRGLARQLLQQCARTGQLWGWDSMWLHVGILNTPAQGLYEQAGFEVVNRGMPWAGPLRQVLMRKPLSPRPPFASGATNGAGRSDASSTGVGSGPGASAVAAVGAGAGTTPTVVGGRTDAGGVFVWQAVVVDGQDQGQEGAAAGNVQEALPAAQSRSGS